MIYQLHISLKGLKPPIWRRVLVSSDTTLRKLHAIIQEVMPWGDSHLYAFEIYGEQYGEPFDDGFAPMKSDERVKLSQVLTNKKDTIEYTYDFGDSWEHKIVLEDILEVDPSIAYPICIAGKKQCPPDDCGGIWGFENLVEILNNPEHPEHKDMAEWFGDDTFDVHEFDLDEINDRLKPLQKKAKVRQAA
jgi:hypothetical protein